MSSSHRALGVFVVCVAFAASATVFAQTPSAPKSDPPAAAGEAGFKGDPCANPAVARAIAGTDKAPQEECTKKLSTGGLKGYTALLAGLRNSAKELAKAGLTIKLVHFVPSMVVTDAVLAAKAGVVGLDGGAPKEGARVKLPFGALIKKKSW